MPLVGVVMGSKSDTEAMAPTIEVLTQLGIDHEVDIISAHRTPEKARQYALSARERGIEVIIAAAGMAAAGDWTTTVRNGGDQPAVAYNPLKKHFLVAFHDEGAGDAVMVRRVKYKGGTAVKIDASSRQIGTAPDPDVAVACLPSPAGQCRHSRHRIPSRLHARTTPFSCEAFSGTARNWTHPFSTSLVLKAL